MRKLPAVAALALSLSGCTSYVRLSLEDRGQISQDLTGGQARYLRLSYYVTPFFGDGSKKFLTALLPTEVHVLETPDAHVISPGPAERILPAGTRVHVRKVEFPTSYDVSTRVMYTPRTQPWVYLTVDGEGSDTPFVLVVKGGSRTKNEFESELELDLVPEDPAGKLAQFTDAVRQGIREKRAVVDMTPEALEAAWGYPERKDVTYVEGQRREVWTYPTGDRKAYVSDGRLQRFDDTAAAR